MAPWKCPGIVLTQIDRTRPRPFANIRHWKSRKCGRTLTYAVRSRDRKWFMFSVHKTKDAEHGLRFSSLLRGEDQGLILARHWPNAPLISSWQGWEGWEPLYFFQRFRFPVPTPRRGNCYQTNFYVNIFADYTFCRNFSDELKALYIENYVIAFCDWTALHINNRAHEYFIHLMQYRCIEYANQSWTSLRLPRYSKFVKTYAPILHTYLLTHFVTNENRLYDGT